MKCHFPLILVILSLEQAWGGLAEFDAVIAQEEANEQTFPHAKLTSPITLDGSGGVPFDFGSVLFDTTIEFIVSGDPLESGTSVLSST